MIALFDILLTVMTVLAGIIIAVALFLFVALPWLWGVADMVGCKRFIDKPEIDFTAGALHWWEVKSLFATQARAMVEKFPWLGMDLSEDREVTDQDGEVT